MRYLFTFFFSVLVFSSVNAQFGGHWTYNFETPPNQYSPQFFIDTSFHNNVWQIGRPHKVIFDSAYSLPNAIVTDTLNPYPVNDTSIFVMKVRNFYPLSPTQSWWSSEFFDFMYKLDIDTGEIARVEISTDSVQWFNSLDTNSGISWNFKPDFSKSTNGWQRFSVRLFDWSHLQLMTPFLYYKFTFIGDSVQTNKDGWMIDDFSCQYWTEGINKLPNNNLISIYPNPSNGNLYIKQNTSAYSKPTISITNLQGIEVYKTDKIPANGYLHLSLPDGVYVLKYVLDDEYAAKRLIIKN
jgi:hypothetical protein